MRLELFVLPGDSLIKGFVNTIKTQVYFHKSTPTVHIRYCAELRGPNEEIKRSPKLYIVCFFFILENHWYVIFSIRFFAEESGSVFFYRGSKLCLYRGQLQPDASPSCYWVPQKIPQICTLILCICIGRVA